MIIAGIVLYEPEKERLLDNIKAIEGQVEQIVCVDNGSSNYDDIYDTILNNYGKVIFIRNKKNDGIARALNQIFEYAKSKQVEWVLTLDQDTVCPHDIVERYMEHMKDEEIAILAPVLVDRNYSRIEAEKAEASVISRCITSASLNRVADWELVGGFFEPLFIDFVDHDYCMRIIKKGRVIKRINSVHVLHEIGHAKEYKIFGVKIVTLNHSSFRKYFIVRNWMYFIRTYKDDVSVVRECMKLIAFVLKTVILEKNKINNINVMVKGIRDSKMLYLEGKSE